MLPNQAYEVIPPQSNETSQKPTASKRRVTSPPTVIPRAKQPTTSNNFPKKQVLPPTLPPRETPSSLPGLAQPKAALPSPKTQREVLPTPPLPQPKVDLPSTQLKMDTPYSAKPTPQAATANEPAQPAGDRPKKAIAPLPQAKKPTQFTADKPKNAVPLPPRTREQQPQSASSPTVESPAHASENSSKQQEAINGEASLAQLPPVKQEAKTGIEDKSSLNQSNQALLAINESLRLLLNKVEKIEQKQTRFETDIAQLKHEESTARDQREIPLEVCSMTQQDVSTLEYCM